MSENPSPMESVGPTPRRGVLLFPVVFGVIHLLIDATTVNVIFSTRAFHGLSRIESFHVVLAYDLIAFAGQLPIGILIDRFRAWRETALLGIMICSLSLAFVRVDPLAAMILAGLGNACFHVGAGALSLHVTPGRAAAPGIFVAPGALGLWLGSYIGKGGLMLFWPFYIALPIAFLVAWRAACPNVPRPSEIEKPDLRGPILIISLLFISILIRSLVGKAGGHALPKALIVGIGMASAAFAGKAMGGIVSDRLGWIRVCVAALLISAPLIAFGGSNSQMVIIGMFLFQMTMPATLVAMAMIIPGRPGLTFGLNCLAYIIGFVPNMFRAFKVYYNDYLFLALILLSAAVLYLGLHMLRDKVKMNF